MAKKSIRITLFKSELVADIQNKTFLTGRSRSTGSNHEEVAHMQANDDDEDSLQVLRSIKNAVSSLKTKLSEFISATATSDDNNLDNTMEANTFIILLNMPSNYNEATVETLTAEAHQYVVNTAVADWFAITNKADAADYNTLAAANIENIREAINKRVRPERVSPVDATTKAETPGAE